jgi:hypothetical protein
LQLRGAELKLIQADSSVPAQNVGLGATQTARSEMMTSKGVTRHNLRAFM